MQLQVSVSQISDTRLKHVLSMAGDGTKDFNCWGATQYVLKAKNSLMWVEIDEMTDWLGKHTTKVMSKQPGDVLALYVEHPLDEKLRRLIHTAVYLGDGKYLHKMGQNRAEVATMSGVLKIYGTCYGLTSVSEIRRYTCD